ncbi:MAG: DUF3617 family protein [Rhodocyclaceae bacterium]
MKADRIRCALVTLCAMSFAAHADDLPKRKPGLWEVNTQIQQMSQPIGPIQQCVDASTDELWHERGLNRGECSKPAFSRSGNTLSFKSVCKGRDTTATSEGIFTGDMNTAYHGEVITRFDPPVRGQSETKVTIDAKWIGACPAGMKPGEMHMPRGITINPAELRGNRQPN